MVKRKRRKFSPEFKAEAVRLCAVGDRTVGQVAKDLDLTETALRDWVRRAEVDAGKSDTGALTTNEREELQRLRRENKRLQMGPRAHRQSGVLTSRHRFDRHSPPRSSRAGVCRRSSMIERRSAARVGARHVDPSSSVQSRWRCSPRAAPTMTVAPTRAGPSTPPSAARFRRAVRATRGVRPGRAALRRARGVRVRAGHLRFGVRCGRRVPDRERMPQRRVHPLRGGDRREHLIGFHPSSRLRGQHPASAATMRGPPSVVRAARVGGAPPRDRSGA
ncbi:Hypothetical protein I5071_830 (plasmid) [Sandaracinus amylolyticus]|nr:Hypothetical protein I5071_830 [Sandaracinus amylolyticus]